MSCVFVSSNMLYIYIIRNICLFYVSSDKLLVCVKRNISYLRLQLHVVSMSVEIFCLLMSVANYGDYSDNQPLQTPLEFQSV
jgi:hypothetical protein